jgi:hypothetical protein
MWAKDDGINAKFEVENVVRSINNMLNSLRRSNKLSERLQVTG